MALGCRWIWAGGPDKDGKGAELSKAVVANCSRMYASSLGTFSGVAGNERWDGGLGGGGRSCVARIGGMEEIEWAMGWG